MLSAPDATPGEGQCVTKYCRFETLSTGRYYQVWATRDLFGPCLVRVWGGVGTARGQMRTDAMESDAAALRALHVVEKRRAQRGYVVVERRVGAA
jgi:predicted DNA-binding WGR domain protein